MDRFYAFDGDFRRQPKTNYFCAFCQKDLNPCATAGYVFLGDPADHIVDPNHLEGGELKAPIGPECQKKVPMRFIVPK